MTIKKQGEIKIIFRIMGGARKELRVVFKFQGFALSFTRDTLAHRDQATARAWSARA